MITYQVATYGPMPAEMAGETVEIRATEDKLNIYYDGQLIASYIIDESM